MGWSFSGDRPIYSQLIELLQLRIVTGFYSPGARLSSVRDLADEAAVNPNTMQRALSELEKQGLLYSQRTAGRFVTEDMQCISRLREQLAREKLEKFLKEMKELGFDQSEIAALLERKDENE